MRFKHSAVCFKRSAECFIHSADTLNTRPGAKIKYVTMSPHHTFFHEFINYKSGRCGLFRLNS